MAEQNLPARISRRGIVSGMAAMAYLAGCLGLSSDSNSVGADADATSTVTTNSTDTTAEETTTNGSTTDAAADLDLREANVLEVAIESEGSGTYGFDLMLYHDDEGEEGYADW